VIGPNALPPQQWDPDERTAEAGCILTRLELTAMDPNRGIPRDLQCPSAEATCRRSVRGGRRE